MPSVPAISAFVDELQKISNRGKGVAELLASKATRAGLDPTKIPSIRQVGNIAGQGNRGRAAEIAKNVRGYIAGKRAPATQVAA